MLEQYMEFIRNLSVKQQYEKEDLIVEELLVKRKDNIEIYWAPFDYINTSAKVVLLGITPGWTQMQNSFKYLRNNLKKEATYDLLKNCKREASFSGPMRQTLVQMLNEIGLHDFLNIQCCSQLFKEENNLVHNTSLLRYPVYVNGKNYTGSNPNMLKKDILRNMIEDIFVQELKFLNDNVIIVPMGKKVSQALEYLQENNKLDNKNILFNFPHPSGANRREHKRFFNEDIEIFKNKISTLK